MIIANAENKFNINSYKLILTNDAKNHINVNSVLSPLTGDKELDDYHVHIKNIFYGSIWFPSIDLKKENDICTLEIDKSIIYEYIASNLEIWIALEISIDGITRTIIIDYGKHILEILCTKKIYLKFKGSDLIKLNSNQSWLLSFDNKSIIPNGFYITNIINDAYNIAKNTYALVDSIENKNLEIRRIDNNSLLSIFEEPSYKTTNEKENINMDNNIYNVLFESKHMCTPNGDMEYYSYLVKAPDKIHAIAKLYDYLKNKEGFVKEFTIDDLNAYLINDTWFDDSDIHGLKNF